MLTLRGPGCLALKGSLLLMLFGALYSSCIGPQDALVDIAKTAVAEDPTRVGGWQH